MTTVDEAPDRRGARLPKVDAIQLDEPAPELSKAAKLATGLRALAAWVEANPELLADQYMTVDLMLPVRGQGRERIAALARSGLRSGAKIAKEQSDAWAGVKLDFGGRVTASVYAPRNEVCDRVVVGTREETKEVPDPEALAAVPKVTVTETVEDVEWRCMPLLQEATS